MSKDPEYAVLVGPYAADRYFIIEHTSADRHFGKLSISSKPPAMGTSYERLGPAKRAMLRLLRSPKDGAVELELIEVTEDPIPDPIAICFGDCPPYQIECKSGSPMCGNPGGPLTCE